MVSGVEEPNEYRQAFDYGIWVESLFKVPQPAKLRPLLAVIPHNLES